MGADGYPDDDGSVGPSGRVVDVEELRALAFKYAKARGFKVEFCEDFSQYVALKRLEGKMRILLRTTLIDYLRHTYGERGSARNEAVEVPWQEIHMMRVLDDQELPIGWECLTGEDRAMFLLIFNWGFAQKDLAHLWGLSEGRISQKVKAILWNLV